MANDPLLGLRGAVPGNKSGHAGQRPPRGDLVLDAGRLPPRALVYGGMPILPRYANKSGRAFGRALVHRNTDAYGGNDW